MTITSSIDVNFIPATSVAASVTSGQKSLSNFKGFSIEATVASGASPTGTFKLQGSIGGTNWADISGTSQAITTNGTILWNVPDTYYAFIRVVYTRTSGTGTLTAIFIGKD